MAETAKKHEVSEQTIYSWRKHFGELSPSDVKHLKALESENAKLMKLLAERDLDIEILKEINHLKCCSASPGQLSATSCACRRRMLP